MIVVPDQTLISPILGLDALKPGRRNLGENKFLYSLHLTPPPPRHFEGHSHFGHPVLVFATLPQSGLVLHLVLSKVSTHRINGLNSNN